VSFVLAAFLAAPAAAAPKLDTVVVSPNPAPFSGGKPPEVQVQIAVSRSRFDSGACDMRVQFGDGEARNVDFSGVAGTRTLRHVYAKGGNFRITVQGAGKTPCEGTREVALSVTGSPDARKAPAKKVEKMPAEKKKAEKKKAEKKKAEKKKAEKKKDEAG
jgi:hypothetical protein